MKSKDLVVGNGYAYNGTRLRPEQRPYYNFQCVVPLDNRVWHMYVKNITVLDDKGNMVSRVNEKVWEPGRKALGYGTINGTNITTPYIEQCGVPCMIARNPGVLRSDTKWDHQLIDPRLIWDEDWSHWENLAKEKAAKVKADQLERERLKMLREAVLLRMSSALNDKRILDTMPVDDTGKRRLMYEKVGYGLNQGGIIIATTDAMTWLATILEDYVELQEEVKDLRYELEG